MMKRKKWLFYYFAVAVFLFGLLLPVAALASHGPAMFGTYAVEDVALSPGADASQLDIAWQTTEADVDNPVCVVIAEKRKIQADGKNFPGDFMKIKGKALSPRFYKNGKPVPPFQVDGTSSEIVDEEGNLAYFDEYDEALYPCEATITGLKAKTKYVYVLGDGDGNWSDVYEYTTRNPERYGMFYIADSQIGASGPKDLSRSSEVKPYIATYVLTSAYPDLSEEEIEALVDAYSKGLLDSATYPVVEIDSLYNIFYADTTDNLDELAAVDEVLAEEIVALRAERLAEQMDAAVSDADGWSETLAVMHEQFPKAAYIISGGDQVENAREYEWTGFFGADELRSLPVAPTVGSHDRDENYDYHFNLPNESSEYGVNSAGGDYYYRYGNALVIVLNMDATTSEYPRGAPPGPPPSGGGGAPSSSSCQEIDSQETFLDDIYNLENSDCETETVEDEDGNTTEVTTCVDELEDFKNSIAEHTAFMQAAIDENPDAGWKIVMWHYSIYSAGNHSADDEIRALRHYFVNDLDTLGIDLVLMAHDHVYTRTYQMLGDIPQTEQTVGRNGEIINPIGTLYVTGSTSSGSKFYSLNCNYDVEDDEATEDVVEGPDVYFEYVAYADDMVRTDDGGTSDDESDDVTVNLRSFSYIDINANRLNISTYGYDSDNVDELELIDSYTMLKLDEKPGHGPHGK